MGVSKARFFGQPRQPDQIRLWDNTGPCAVQETTGKVNHIISIKSIKTYHENEEKKKFGTYPQGFDFIVELLTPKQSSHA